MVSDVSVHCLQDAPGCGSWCEPSQFAGCYRVWCLFWAFNVCQMIQGVVSDLGLHCLPDAADVASADLLTRR